MKAGNWLKIRVHHIKPKRRKEIPGLIEATWHGIQLRDFNHKYLDIELTDEEATVLINQLTKIQIQKEQDRNGWVNQ